jgi:hypothetical protein
MTAGPRNQALVSGNSGKADAPFPCTGKSHMEAQRSSRQEPHGDDVVRESGLHPSHAMNP